jgi:hypothetical protein
VDTADRRVASRIQSNIPIETDCGSKCVTRDLSSSGVYFETDGSFSPGQSIKFSIEMEYVYPDRPVMLQCEGRIVRIDKAEGMIGVAATIDSYSVVDRLP